MLSTSSKILIILMGSVGDVARGLTVANAIKKSNPNHTIAWVVEPASQDLVKLCPAIDTPIIFDRKVGLGAVLPLIKGIRAFKADVVLDLQRHAKSGFFSACSGAPYRLGFHPKDSKEGNFLFQTDYIPAQAKNLNKMLHYWEFLKALAVPVPENAEVPLPIPSESALQGVLPRKEFTCVILGTRWETKRWPIEGYQKFLRLMESQGKSVVLVGGKEDVTIADPLAKKFPTALNLVGKTTLAELCFVLNEASAAVGPDSGPAHIAAALGVPHVTLFGPTDPQRTAPYGYESLAIQSQVPCRGCYRKKCPGLGTLCMRSIQPQEVFDKISTVLPR